MRGRDEPVDLAAGGADQRRRRPGDERGGARGGAHRAAPGAEIFAVYEGYQGLVDGGDRIRPVSWDDVSGILNRGGTVIGTARSAEFRERAGRRRAVLNLVERGIDRLVVIGGDGSLSRRRPAAAGMAVAGRRAGGRTGRSSSATADRHPALMIAGLVGSIDNDMIGTEMTIGADSALHRIVEAIDAIASTAASHQRSFVVEVMGRHCGYLALMSAIAGDAAYVLIPEDPRDPAGRSDMCKVLKDGRAAGPAEQHRDHRRGRARQREQADHQRVRPPGAGGRLGEDTRVTILGHVQRGGAPSAFDRSMSSIVGTPPSRRCWPRRRTACRS